MQISRLTENIIFYDPTRHHITHSAALSNDLLQAIYISEKGIKKERKHFIRPHALFRPLDYCCGGCSELKSADEHKVIGARESAGMKLNSRKFLCVGSGISKLREII